MVVENECNYCTTQDRYPDSSGDIIAESAYEDCYIDTSNNHLVVSGDDIGSSRIYYCPMCGRKLESDKGD